MSIRASNELIVNPKFTNEVQETSWVWDQVVRTYNLMCPAGSVVELRCLDSSKGTISGYYNDPNLLARDAVKWSGDARGVYITLQSVNPLLIHRSANAYQTFAKKDASTKNHDIVGYLNILLDFDTVRPAGISATDEEVAVAIETATRCRDYLRGEGFLEPILACSGNGAHLVYAVRLGAGDKNLVKSFLRAIGARFSTDKVNVDQSVFDPAQITKLYGTRAKKGTASDQRPHRHAQILEAPDSLQPVPRSLLELVVEPPDAKPAKEHGEGDHWCRQFRGDLRTLDIRALFQDLNLDVEDDGICDCPWGDEHSEATTGTKLWDAEDGNYPGFNCKHSHCEGRGIREVLEKFGVDAVDRRCAATFGAGKHAPDDTEERIAEVMAGNPPRRKNEPVATDEPGTIGEKLVALIQDNAELFRDDDGTPFARVRVDNHHETMPVASKMFKNWMVGLWYERAGKPLKPDPAKEAIGVAEYFASREPRRKVYLRWAWHHDKVYLDLGNDAWEVAEISATGWKIVDDDPVVFRRSANTGSFPTPSRAGSLDALRPFFTGGDDAYHLWLGSILAATTAGSYFVTCIHGEQGSAKSWACRFARRLVDPVGKVELTSLPKQIDDDIIKVISQRHAVCFDNVSSITGDVSDFLCTLSTGGGQQVRQLYSDDELRSYDYKRPVWINGIPDFAERPDLADRSITLSMPVLTTRADEEELEERWRRALPFILGGLLDTIAGGLRRYQQTPKAGSFRMAGSVRWVNACLNSDRFSTLYVENRESSAETGLDSSPVTAILADYIKSPQPYGARGCYRGTASELHRALLNLAQHRGVDLGKKFPSAANYLSSELKRITPALRERRRINVEFKSIKGSKVIEIKLVNVEVNSTPDPVIQTTTITTSDANATIGEAEWGLVQSIPDLSIPYQETRIINAWLDWTKREHPERYRAKYNDLMMVINNRAAQAG